MTNRAVVAAFVPFLEQGFRGVPGCVLGNSLRSCWTPKYSEYTRTYSSTYTCTTTWCRDAASGQAPRLPLLLATAATWCRRGKLERIHAVAVAFDMRAAAALQRAGAFRLCWFFARRWSRPLPILPRCDTTYGAGAAAHANAAGRGTRPVGRAAAVSAACRGHEVNQRSGLCSPPPH